MKMAVWRMKWKIRDLIDELHHKAANFLVKNFDLLLLPTFETSEMVIRGKRKIRSQTVRSMLTFAHYRFKRFLRYKCKEYGKKLVEVNEAYTSKTCSWNGVIKNIAGAKYIEDGNVCVGRDINAVCGVLIRSLSELTSAGNLAVHSL